jgi:hypothetical protein
MLDETVLIIIAQLEDRGLRPLARTIAAETKINCRLLRIQLRRMVELQLINCVNGIYRLTDVGLAAIDCARDHPYPVEDWGGFADEVLTGLTSDGARTEIRYAALPKKWGRQHNGNCAEDRFIRDLANSDTLANLLDNHPWLGVDRLVEYYDDNLIYNCIACGNLAVHKTCRAGLTCINCQREELG